MNDAASGMRRGAWLKQVREWLIVIIAAIFIAMALRTFVVQQFYIAGPSMEVTLFGNDRVLVNKLSYRFGSPSRGDVIVFDRITVNGDTVQHDDLIKRVIGLPGETLTITDCIVSINGSVLNEPWLDDQELDSTLAPGLRCGSGDVGPTTMGENEVFLIGDNRPMSFDSRMFGPVDIDLIVGRAVVVIWPPSSVSIL